MFATEYAPFGDLTSNVGERGVGEQCAKRIAKQVALALEWVHGLGLCHLDVKLDNILVFRSDFSWVKLCDFGAVRPQADLAVKKSELLPYCPPELAVLPSGQSYRVDRSQDVFQFGVVTFFCVFGALPWQRAGGPDPSDAADPGYAEFAAWRAKKPGARTPRAFKPLTSRGQKFFRKLMDVDPAKRLALTEVPKFLDDRWMKKSVNGGGGGNENANDGCRFLSDGVSQLTMGSFRSVHSNAAEKNKVLYTLLQHGVETTVDRSQKNSRIINWIRHGRPEVTKDDDQEDELNGDAKVNEGDAGQDLKSKNVICNGDRALKNSTAVCQSD